jgi:hypothetical protein
MPAAGFRPASGKVGLKASTKPYRVKRRSPYRACIAISAGRTISGANGSDPAAAVGAIVPSSRMSPLLAPRAQ